MENIITISTGELCIESLAIYNKVLAFKLSMCNLLDIKEAPMEGATMVEIDEDACKIIYYMD